MALFGTSHSTYCMKLGSIEMAPHLYSDSQPR